MRNKKGFTLVELLGIIIVMGLIVTLLVPNVNKIIKNSEDKTFKESVKSIIRAAENYMAEEEFNLSEGQCFNINDGKITIKESDQIKSGEVCVIDSQPFLKHVSNGDKCASGGVNDLETYKCGEKSIVIIKSDALSNSNSSLIDIPYYAFIVKRGDKLVNHIKRYKETIVIEAATHEVYNIWKQYKIDVVPSTFSPAFTDTTPVHGDATYAVESVLKTDGSQIINEISPGRYKIKYADNSAFVLGYPSAIVSSVNVVQQNTDDKIWDIFFVGDGSMIFKPIDAMSFSIDVFGGLQIKDAFVTLYNYSLTKQQKYITINEGSGVFTIRAFNDQSLCFTPETLSYSNNNKIVLSACDDANRYQKFKFEKVS